MPLLATPPCTISTGTATVFIGRPLGNLALAGTRTDVDALLAVIRAG